MFNMESFTLSGNRRSIEIVDVRIYAHLVVSTHTLRARRLIKYMHIPMGSMDTFDYLRLRQICLLNNNHNHRSHVSMSSSGALFLKSAC